MADEVQVDEATGAAAALHVPNEQQQAAYPTAVPAVADLAVHEEEQAALAAAHAVHLAGAETLEEAEAKAEAWRASEGPTAGAAVDGRRNYYLVGQPRTMHTTDEDGEVEVVNYNAGPYKLQVLEEHTEVVTPDGTVLQGAPGMVTATHAELGGVHLVAPGDLHHYTHDGR